MYDFRFSALKLSYWKKIKPSTELRNKVSEKSRLVCLIGEKKATTMELKPRAKKRYEEALRVVRLACFLNSR